MKVFAPRHVCLLFLLVPTACVPHSAHQASQTWAFTPKPDEFSPNALLDLRFLNEKTAGESGYLKVSPDGDFLLGNGKPVRFWAVNSGVGRDFPFQPRPLGRQTEPDLARHARFLAKRGVNMIRLHTHINPDPKQPVESIDTKERDYIWRAVAAFRKEGIYTTLSPYWAIQARIGKDWGISTGGQGNAAALLFFEPKLQKAYRDWLRQLLVPKNPYSGVSLALDPSLGVLSLQNEDSLLFWTINGLKGEPRQILGEQFGSWLKSKYGSIAAAAKRWDGTSSPEDKFDQGFVDFLNVWELTQARTGGQSVRIGDQLEFWTETMRKFNADTVAFLRDDLGYKGLVNAGNWRTADTVRLNDAERYSYTSTDVDAVNHYFGGIHKGPNEGWAVMNGDKFTNDSALKQPWLLPTNLKQTVGRPIMITESSWVMPNGNAAEGPFLTSAYQSLNGVDAFFWFATGDDEWSHPTSANGYQPSQAKWVMGNPDMLGTFPGAALMYRMGYIKRGTPVVVEKRMLADVWARKIPLISEESGFDPNRDNGDVAGKSNAVAAIDPRAFLIGPVQVRFGDGSQSVTHSLSPYVNGPEIKSNTGEITLNTLLGACTVDSPSAQGVSAWFENQATFKLSTVTFSSQNPFGAAVAVSMDGQPLATSRKILVQYATESRPTGWKDKAVQIQLDGGKSVPGREVVDFGKAPWAVVSAKLEVRVKNPFVTKGIVLDMNGNAVREISLSRSSQGVSGFSFPSDAMYVVLR